MSVARCQQEVSPEEFHEWIAFNELEPWTVERLDYLFGMLASVITNCARSLSGRKGGRTARPRDFMPQFDRVRPTLNDLGQKAAAIFGALGIKRVDGNDKQTGGTADGKHGSVP